MAREHGGVVASRRWVLVAGLAALLAGICAGAAATSAWSWQRTLAEEARLLPGVRVAGVDLGTPTLQEARAVTHRVEAAALDRSIIVADGQREWSVTPRDVGATTTAARQLAAAAAATGSTPLPHLAMIRWLGVPGRIIDVTVDVPAEGLLAFVDELAEAVDRASRDATAAWISGALRVRDPAPGRRLDRAAAAADILTALRGASQRVELSATEVAPAVTAEQVRHVLPAVEVAADAALDRSVTIVHEQQRWSVTPRALDAVPAVQAAVEAALATHDTLVRSGRTVAAQTAATAPAPAPVGFDVPDRALGALLDRISAQISRGARPPTVDSSSGWVQVVPGQPGQTVDRHGAAVRLREALDGGLASVELPVRQTRPGAADLPQVLLVRQNERRVYLYERGEIVADWPVAVGQAGADTPTGTFTVGAKRANPIWYNPAPDGWGADMPRIIGPGPGNPLGLRAVNWNSGDTDTLIRFHGTANSGSIGQAASRGCVRLTNAHIVELFDLVEPGATIVSVRA